MKMFAFFCAGIVLVCTDFLLGQAAPRPSANVTVTVVPVKVTLYAGERQTFVARVVGIDNQAVNWAVEEEDGGTITDIGLYQAPKIQGVYHITATTRGRPEAKGIATITVFAYCDPHTAAFRR